ncbi:MAG TPA: hypothetical protein VLY04_08470 [Bryobacteraceae bacterium]|nr:hypothetical protein [Bryobacteraceae bacterium]
MKKLMTLMLGMALTFGAVSMYAGKGDPQKGTGKAKTTHAPKAKKSTEKK